MNEERIKELERRVKRMEEELFRILNPQRYKEGDEVWIRHWGKDFKGTVSIVVAGTSGGGIDSFHWRYFVILDSSGRSVEVSEDQLSPEKIEKEES